MTDKEAFRRIRDWVLTGNCTNGFGLGAIVNLCDSALAKPERNCDRYPTYDTAFAVWRNGTQNSNFGEWLLETADNNP